jgi:hypothetical protein
MLERVRRRGFRVPRGVRWSMEDGLRVCGLVTIDASKRHHRYCHEEISLRRYSHYGYRESGRLWAASADSKIRQAPTV